jgi:hypothetical protein
MPRPPAVSLALALLAGAGAARAAESDWDGDFSQKAERRSDFTAGLTVAPLVASVYGYPNSAGKVGNDRYVADPGVGVGSIESLWIGGALRDWFTFGVGATWLSYETSGVTSAGGGMIFRIETFPLWAYGGVWRDVGAYASFGIGGLTLKKDGHKVGDGGAVSIAAFGAFWEPVRFGVFSFGPTAEYTLISSRSVSFRGASAGARLVLYTGP